MNNVLIDKKAFHLSEFFCQNKKDVKHFVSNQFHNKQNLIKNKKMMLENADKKNIKKILINKIENKKHYKTISFAEYKGSATNPQQFFSDFPEIAFVGRSNVGKSSFINSLVNMKKLAHTSSMPGRTRMINYFLINKCCYFVDLPGYGYASASKVHKQLWSKLIEDYLLNSKQLKLVFLLVDIRHKPSNLDLIMQQFLYANNIPTKIIATKSDKVAKSKIVNYTLNIATTLSVGIDDIIPFSINNIFEKEKVLKIINKFI